MIGLISKSPLNQKNLDLTPNQLHFNYSGIKSAYLYLFDSLNWLILLLNLLVKTQTYKIRIKSTLRGKAANMNLNVN